MNFPFLYQILSISVAISCQFLGGGDVQYVEIRRQQPDILQSALARKKGRTYAPVSLSPRTQSYCFYQENSRVLIDLDIYENMKQKRDLREKTM